MITRINGYISLLTLFILISVWTTYGKPINNLAGCKFELTSVYKNEEGKMHNAVLSGNGWHMQYRVVSNVLNPSRKRYETVTTNGELIAGKHIRYLKTDHLEVFMDQEDVFTVNASTKNILRTVSTLSLSRSNEDIYGVFVRDSIFKKYKLVSCAEYISSPHDSVLKYDLVPLNENKSKCLKMSVYVDIAEKTLKKIEMQLNPKYSKMVQSSTIIFDQEGEIKLDKCWNHVRDKVLNKNGRLLERYEDYTYQDLKNKKANK